MKQLRFHRPPRALRRAQLDNVAIVPANLLPYKAIYQRIANGLPPGTTLIVVPEAPGKPGQTLGSVATQLQGKGHQVKVVPANRLLSDV